MLALYNYVVMLIPYAYTHSYCCQIAIKNPVHIGIK